MLASCLDAIAMSRFLPHTCQPLIFHDTVSNHPTQQTVVWLWYRFAQPLYNVLVAGAVQVVPCWDMDMLGYHNISYLINASIYLVVCGRLGLLPSVLFHSCRLSFRNTGVMFLDEHF